MSLNIRLKKARAKKKLTQQQLADIIGVKQQAIQRIEAGKVKSTTFMVQIAKALDVSADWLVHGPGNEPIPAQLEVREQNAHYGTAFPTVPLLEWQELTKAAEIIAHLTEHEDSERKRIPCYIPNSSKAFAVRLTDDSMLSHDGKTSFPKDEIIIADPGKQAHDGSFVLVKTPQVIFRKYVTGSNGGHLQALNTKYESLSYHKPMQIFATVIERISVLP